MIIAFVPYTKENDVALVESLADVLYAHNISYNLSRQLPFFASSHLFVFKSTVLLLDSAKLLTYG